MPYVPGETIDLIRRDCDPSCLPVVLVATILGETIDLIRRDCDFIELFVV